MSDINILNLYIKGQQALDSKHSQLETKKVGTLRGGSVGALQDGTYYQNCAAKAWLRFKGIDTNSIEFDKLDYGIDGKITDRSFMFAAGNSNEDIWVDVLKQSWESKELNREIKTEEEMPTKWMLESGEAVTGRPDIGLYENGVLKKGIELKLVSSLWTARDVLFGQTPKTIHLLQAAHYSWASKAPFDLYYTSRADFHMANNSHLFPKMDSENAQFIQWAYYRLGDINPNTGRRRKHRSNEQEYYELHYKDRTREALKVLPFVCGYNVKIDEETGQISYRPTWNNSHNEWVHTPLGIQDIKEYYESLPKLEKVPTEPALIKPDGSKMNYKASQYCSLNELCCKYKAGKDINKWAEEIAKKIK